MTIDLLGFGNTDNAATVRPARTIVRGATDTWAQDCSSPDASDGTSWPADIFNDLLAQMRTALRNSGITLDNADDMLWRAMQSMGIRYGVDTGAAGALTVTFAPAVTSLYAGLAVLVNAAQDCPGATTFTPNAQATKSVAWPDGTALSTGDYKAGCILLLVYDGVKWQLLFQLNGGATGGGAQFVPGCVYTWPTEVAPTGTLRADGAAVSRTTYARLFGIIGTTYGVGNGTSTFNLPNCCGNFLRFWDPTATVDVDAGSRTNRGDGTTGNHVGTKQAAAAGAISLTGAAVTIANVKIVDDFTPGGPHDRVFAYTTGVVTESDGPSLKAVSADSNDYNILKGDLSLSGQSGSAETRGKNIAFLPIIAY